MVASIDNDVAYMELVEMENGDVVLRRVEDRKVLLKISFGDVSDNPRLKYLSTGKMEIAKAMVHAGYKAFAKLAAESMQDEQSEESLMEEASQEDSPLTATDVGQPTKIKGKNGSLVSIMTETSTTVH